MRFWQTLERFFPFQSVIQNSSSTALSEIYSELEITNNKEKLQPELDNIRFDNFFRLTIACTALLTSLCLRGANLVPSIVPFISLFFIYLGLEVLGTYFLFKVHYHRLVNYYLCFVDLVSIGLAVYWTGCFSSPFYYIFFIPLIIQAFHRDWGLLMFYGLGGMVVYASLILASLANWSFSNLVSSGGHLFFMAITVSISLSAVAFLRQRELLQLRRISRLKCMVQTSHILNGVYLSKDLEPAIQKLTGILNVELGTTSGDWVRIYLLLEGESLMQAVPDIHHSETEFKPALPSQMCPAIMGNQSTVKCEANGQPGCPNQNSVSLLSQICIPIRGEMNECYGLMFLGSSRKEAFGDEDIQFFQFVSKTLGLTIHRIKKTDELNQVFELDSASMATFMGSTRTIDDTFIAIADGVKTILNADQVSILLWTPEKGRLESHYVQGAYSKEGRRISLMMGEGIQGKVLETGEPAWSYDRGKQNSSRLESAFQGLLCVPLHSVRGEPLGVISAAILNPQRTFSVEEIDLASTFCTRAAVAIENALMHQKERAFNDPNSEMDFPDVKAA